MLSFTNHVHVYEYTTPSCTIYIAPNQNPSVTGIISRVASQWMSFYAVSIQRAAVTLISISNRHFSFDSSLISCIKTPSHETPISQNPTDDPIN
jgi:hypothetical protein